MNFFQTVLKAVPWWFWLLFFGVLAVKKLTKAFGVIYGSFKHK